MDKSIFLHRYSLAGISYFVYSDGRVECPHGKRRMMYSIRVADKKQFPVFSGFRTELLAFIKHQYADHADRTIRMMDRIERGSNDE